MSAAPLSSGARDEPLAIMDWKSRLDGPQQQQAICHRWECFNCEFYKRNVMGGLVLDGQRSRVWWCELIDVKHEPCKIDDKIGQQLTEKFLPGWERKQRQATEVIEPRPLGAETVIPGLQPRLSQPLVSHKPHLDKAISSKSNAPVSNLPRVETLEQRRRSQKRKRT